MSKPSKKNRIMCPDCGKPKLLFETESKAMNFIKWNGEDMDNGDSLRPYYCEACGGYHITHKKHKKVYDSNTSNLINAFNRALAYGDSMLSSYRKTVLQITKDERAKDIWDSIPQEVKDGTSKSNVRKCISEYFNKYNLFEADGGKAREIVYKLWEKNLKNLKN